MANEFLIPHPNIPTADIGIPKLKEVTVKNNENFLALDRLLKEVNSGMFAIDKKIESTKHDHPYAPLVHEHQLTDVVGLIAALENKAPLVHNHPQYLTSVPEHNHTIYNVNGLVEALAGKANAQHVHNMDEVNGLLNALAAKASAADVNWLFENMAKLTQSETPLVDGYGESGDGNVGSSTNAAKADHQHPINVNTDGDKSKMKADGFGSNGTADFGSLLSYARTDHSHPLNYPDPRPKPIQDGINTESQPATVDRSGSFGNLNYYADAGHSHPLNLPSDDSVLKPMPVVKNNGTDSLGTSNWYARHDHVHKMPELSSSDIKHGTNSTAGATLDDHGTRITALEGRFPQRGFVKSVAGVGPGTDGNVATASIVSALSGTTSGTLAVGDHTHSHNDVTDFDDAVQSLIDEDLEKYAKKDDFPIDEDTGVPTEGNIFQHSHWAEDVLIVSGSSGQRRLHSYFESTGNDIDGGQVRLQGTGKWVKTNAGTGRLETTEDQPVTTDGTEERGFIPVYDDDGNLTNSAIPDASIASSGQVLTADGDGAATWKDAEVKLDQIEDGKVVVGESFAEGGESKIRLTSKSNFAKDIDALLLKTSGQVHKVEIDAQKVRFKEVLGSPDAGDFVCLDANLNLTAVRPETKLADYAKESDLSSVRTIANNAVSAASSAASDASRAITTANGAKSAADDAKVAADAAQEAADQAQAAIDELTTTVGEVQTSLGETNTKLDNQIETFSNFQAQSFEPLQQLVDEISGDYVTGTEYDAKMGEVDSDIGELKTSVASALKEEDLGTRIATLDLDGTVERDQLPDITVEDLPVEAALLGGALESGSFVAANASGALVTPADQPLKKSEADDYYASKSTEQVASGAASAAAAAEEKAQSAKTAADKAQSVSSEALQAAQTAQQTAQTLEGEVSTLSATVSGHTERIGALDNELGLVNDWIQSATPIIDEAFPQAQRDIEDIKTNKQDKSTLASDVAAAGFLPDEEASEKYLSDEDVGVYVAELSGGVVPKSQLPDIELEDLPEEVAYTNGLTEGKFVKAAADGSLVSSQEDPVVAASQFSNDCLAAAFVSGSSKSIKTLANPFASEQTLSDMIYASQVGSEAQYDLYFKPPKFDKYGRFTGYGNPVAILRGIYAG